MIFSIKRSEFIQKMNDVMRAISNKTTLEILKGLKIEVSAEALTLTGSNSDISIESVFKLDDKSQLDIQEPGAIVLSARFFSEIVRRLPDEMMTVAVNERGQATITSGQSEFHINGASAIEYPHLPEVPNNSEFTLSSDILSQIINQTVIATSKQENRPMLTGVHLLIQGTKLLAVATDSHRLSQRIIEIPDVGESQYDVIIPGRSLIELSKMLNDTQDDVKVRISDNQILFTFEQTSFYSRLLEGIYPDTQRLIPTTSNTVIEFDAVELLHAIDRASLLSHVGNANVVKLSVQSDENKIVLSSNSSEIGHTEEELKFNSVKGDNIEISFNPDYMKDALQSFKQSEIKVSFTQALRPFTIVPSEDDGSFVQLITPVRTA